MMKPSMAGICASSYVVCSLLVMVLSVTPTSSTAQCLREQFLDRKTGECKPCSACPVNRIVRRRCTGYKDTVCTPFYEFDFFNQGPENEKPESFAAQLTTQRAGVEPQISVEENNVSLAQTRGPSLQQAGRKWKTLSFGLIGALAAIVLVASLCLVGAHFRARRSTAKPVSLTDADGTVYVQAEFMNPQMQRDEGSSRKPRFLHLETQLAKNKHHKRILRRLFRPGVKFFWGNDYVEQAVDAEAAGSGSFLLDTIPEAESTSAPVDTSSPRQSPPQLRSVTDMSVAQV